jgi:hypothetical protein
MLFDDIPDSDRKNALMREVVENLQEKVADLMARGKAEEDAVNQAIVEFGDIEDIRMELRAPGETDPNARRNAALSFGYALCGALLMSALFVYLNLYAFKGFPWCAIPIFGVLWWPLWAFFHWMKTR